MTSPYSADRLRRFGAVLLISMLVYCARAANGASSTNQVGETLIPLKAGEAGVGGLISYGLFCGVSGSSAASNYPAGSDLFLILRNNGAKNIRMDKVTVEDFKLQDSQGRDIKLFLWTQPRGMGYGEATVIHLAVNSSTNAVQPWTLSFKTADVMVPLDLTITGIEPRKK